VRAAFYIAIVYPKTEAEIALNRYYMSECINFLFCDLMRVNDNSERVKEKKNFINGAYIYITTRPDKNSRKNCKSFMCVIYALPYQLNGNIYWLKREGGKVSYTERENKNCGQVVGISLVLCRNRYKIIFINILETHECLNEF
jgi:hypothetical protein